MVAQSPIYMVPLVPILRARVASSDAASFKIIFLADSAVWAGCSSLMRRSSAKPLQEPSTCGPSIRTKGANSIMDDGVWWFRVPRLKVLSKDLEKMRGASDVSMNYPCCAMKVNSPLCPCLLHRFSLSARESSTQIGERLQMRFAKRGQVPSHTSLCQHRSLSPSSSDEALPIWREVFIPPSETVSRTVAAKRRFQMRVPSIPFCPLRLSIRMPFE